MHGCAAVRGVTYRMGRSEKTSPLWPARTSELSQEMWGGNVSLHGVNRSISWHVVPGSDACAWCVSV